ncbi:GNAT family N-acetyltransferase [Actinorhabdospora filicis]|uniref:GNAT family N-acetyltransferase n=1 Tax=Actinorhabdospora filicis TaxID=1785913 RepID=UPI00255492AC|nr:GNAT family N-acetyltransferase [Actinorhabdospora filicis]
MEFELVDPADPVRFDEYIALLTAVKTADHPEDAHIPVSRVEELAGMRYPWPGELIEYWQVLLDGELVGSYDIGFPQLENLRTAWTGGQVHPDHRRKGIGRRMWAHALERAAAHGRSVIGSGAHRGVEGGPPRDGAGLAFLAAMGMGEKLDEAHRRVVLSTVDQADLDAMLAEAWTHAGGYRLRRWINHAPEDLVDGLAYLDGRLLQDAPMGDLDIEPEKVDRDRFREGESMLDRRMRTRFHAALQHEETGAVAAWTTFNTELEYRERAHVGVTIVDPDHRGKRLGTIAKIELQNWARLVEPAIVEIDTWNAESNAYMISINERMGYRLVESAVDFQGPVPGVAE